MVPLRPDLPDLLHPQHLPPPRPLHPPLPRPLKSLTPGRSAPAPVLLPTSLSPALVTPRPASCSSAPRRAPSAALLSLKSRHRRKVLSDRNLTLTALTSPDWTTRDPSS